MFRRVLRLNPARYIHGDMKLDHWLRLNGISTTKFGEMIDVSQPSVHRYARGGRVPIPKIMRRIMRATNGQVTPNDWYEDTVSSPKTRRRRAA